MFNTSQFSQEKKKKKKQRLESKNIMNCEERKIVECWMTIL